MPARDNPWAVYDVFTVKDGEQIWGFVLGLVVIVLLVFWLVGGVHMLPQTAGNGLSALGLRAGGVVHGRARPALPRLRRPGPPRGAARAPRRCWPRRSGGARCCGCALGPYRIMYTVEGDLITILRVDRRAG